MARQCSICVDERRLEIDRLLIQGHGTYVQIAEEFGFSHGQVRNHAINHLSRQLATTYGRRELIQNTKMIDELKEVLESAKSIFQRNYDQGRDNMALKALDSIRMTLELVARIAAYIHEARMMEERANQQTADELNQEQDQKFLRQAMSRLTYNELDMLQKLLAKANGDNDEVIIPDDNSPYTSIEHNLNNEEDGRDPNESVPENDRACIDYDKDFSELPSKSKMRRTK